MKSAVLKLFGKSALPALVLGSLLMVMSPVSALAQRGGGGHGGGHSFSGGARGFSGGGGYSGGARSFSGGGAYRGGGGYYGGGYTGRGYYRGGGYYGGGLYFGAPYAYGYAAPACGFYDQWGAWRADPGCYYGAPGYGY